LGLYAEPASAARAVGALRQAGFAQQDVDILTDTPYPEGAFGEAHTRHRLFVFPLIGAACGFAVGLLLTVGTQIDYPLVTGGRPILSIPPMINVMYEGTMLGAIIFTVLGIIFESRLPWFGQAPYDPRISEGYIGVLVASAPARLDAAEQALRQAGAADIVREAGARPPDAPTRGRGDGGGQA
jgi:hypothetical protein